MHLYLHRHHTHIDSACIVGTADSVDIEYIAYIVAHLIQIYLHYQHIHRDIAESVDTTDNTYHTISYMRCQNTHMNTADNTYIVDTT